jgi:putrescine aminotransferase
MRSKKELSEMDRKYVLHPTSQLKDIQDNGPRIIVEGDGVRVKDVDGNEYIDAFSTL